jgi:hypothetical protein
MTWLTSIPSKNNERKAYIIPVGKRRGSSFMATD